MEELPEENLSISGNHLKQESQILIQDEGEVQVLPKKQKERNEVEHSQPPYHVILSPKTLRVIRQSESTKVKRQVNLYLKMKKKLVP